MTGFGAAAALATKPSRAIVGPLSTQSGFQYWYLACFPDCIVAVRQSIGAFFVFGMANGAAPSIFGLLGVLINHLVRGKVQGYRQRIEATLASTPTSRLRMKPNVVYQTMQLKSITFKPVKNGGGLILPDVILETKDGKKQKYGMQPADFDKACAQLKQMYPELCK
jgi:hypothetical protein